MPTDDELERRLILDEALARDRGPKLQFVVTDPVAYAKWCAERDLDPQEALDACQDAVRPADRERQDD
ncbi:MAG TPA: hypothetical protein VIJ94_11405 [Caulobacteraceae bacterium]